MKLKLFALLLFAGGSLLAQSRWSIGIGIGVPYYAPPPPPPMMYYTPPCPGPDYMWVPGYYYPRGGRYAWRGGYWTRPPFAGAFWVEPRYDDHRYYSGYWERGDRDWDWDRGRGKHWERHDRGKHRGWYKRHEDEE